MADSAKNSNSRIAFTLPISCQICLGKVKVPVVCPNQHVFCSPCMDVWLQRNQQCPSCRVPITNDNPCKKILGGLSNQDEEETSFAQNKELRRSRIELLCKDYEDEIERLQGEKESLQHENKLLEDQVTAYNAQKLKDTEDDVSKGKASSSSSSHSLPPQPDANMLIMLTKKLQDATGLYERVKKDMDKLKQENALIKDENAGMTRENQRIRKELVERSPRKFGRFTVATLESQLDRQDKEVKQLQKALERSDAYIEEVEKELEGYRAKLKAPNMCIRCRCAVEVEKVKDMESEKSNQLRDRLRDLAGKEPVSDHQAESSCAAPKLRQSQSLDRDTKNDLNKSEAPKRSSSMEDWRSLPPPPPGDKNQRNATKQDSGGGEKPNLTIGSFYGKRPRAPGAGKSTTSQSKNVPYSKTAYDDSFELEMPSPTSSSMVSSIDTTVGRTFGENDCSDLVSTSDMKHTPNNSTLDANDTLLVSAGSAESCKKRLKFESDTSDISGLSSALSSPKKGASGASKKSSSSASSSTSGGGQGKQVTFNNNVAVKNMIKHRSALSDSVLDVTLPSDTSEIDILNDIKPASHNANTTADESTLDANMSMNSDIMDCMELFSCAERRLDKMKSRPLPGDEQTGKRGAGLDGGAHERNTHSAPPGDFLQTYPASSSSSYSVSQSDNRSNKKASNDFNPPPFHHPAHGASQPLSHPPGVATFSPSGSRESTAISNGGVSSSVDPVKSYMPPSNSGYSDYTIPSSTFNPELYKPKPHPKSASMPTFPDVAPINHPVVNNNTNTNNNPLDVGLAGMRNFSASLRGTNRSDIPASLCTDSLMTSTYPPRPSSSSSSSSSVATSTLQGMIHRLNSLEEESSTGTSTSSSRPLSAPGVESSVGTSKWRDSTYGANSISSTTDFRAAGSLPLAPPTTTTTNHPTFPHANVMGGLPGGSAGSGRPNPRLSGSQGHMNSMNTLPNFPGSLALPSSLATGGIPSCTPGADVLSQPSLSLYGATDLGPVGLFGNSGGFPGNFAGFGGGLTQ